MGQRRRTSLPEQLTQRKGMKREYSRLIVRLIAEQRFNPVTQLTRGRPRESQREDA